MSQKLNGEEAVDSIGFWNGGKMSDNTLGRCRPILYTIWFLARLKYRRWNCYLYSNRGALFLLGYFLYEQNRWVVSGKRPAAIRRMGQKERV